MTSRIKYIFSFFIILSLFGFGENAFTNFPSVKNIKETKWITRSTPNSKVSKCYHYNQCSKIISANPKLHSWSIEYIVLYDQKVNVKLISQAKICDNINTINLIVNKIFIPRKSIEYHDISKNGTGLSMQHGTIRKINGLLTPTENQALPRLANKQDPTMTLTYANS